MVRFIFLFILFMANHLYAADISWLTNNGQLLQELKDPKVPQPLDTSKVFLKGKNDNELILLIDGKEYILPFSNISNLSKIKAATCKKAFSFSLLNPLDPLPMSLFVSSINSRIKYDISQRAWLEGEFFIHVTAETLRKYAKNDSASAADLFLKSPDLNLEALKREYAVHEQQLNSFMTDLTSFDQFVGKQQTIEDKRNVLDLGIEKALQIYSKAAFMYGLLYKLSGVEYVSASALLPGIAAWAQSYSDKYQQMLNEPILYAMRTHFDGIIDSFKAVGNDMLILLNNIKVSMQGAAVTAPAKMIFKMDPAQLRNIVYLPNSDPTQPRIESTLGELIAAARDVQNAKGRPITGRALTVICNDTNACRYDYGQNLINGNMYFSGFFDEDIRAVVLAKRKQAQVVAGEAQRVANINQKNVNDAAMARQAGRAIYKNIFDINTALRNAKANQALIDKIFDDVLYCFRQGILRKLGMQGNVFDLSNLDMTSIPPSFPEVFARSDAFALNLANNKLSTLKGLDRIPAGKLRGLDISYNVRINSLKLIVGHSLIQFNANNTQLGQDMGALIAFARGPSSSSLTHLSLDNAGLTRLDFVVYLRVIETLSVSYNPIALLPLQFSGTLKEIMMKRMADSPPIDAKGQGILDVLLNRGVRVLTQ